LEPLSDRISASNIYYKRHGKLNLGACNASSAEENAMTRQSDLMIVVPDSKLAAAATELIRDTESGLLFHHSTRVYLWGALIGA
jgi:hypothetical protein